MEVRLEKSAACLSFVLHALLFCGFILISRFPCIKPEQPIVLASVRLAMAVDAAPEKEATAAVPAPMEQAVVEKPVQQPKVVLKKAMPRQKPLQPEQKKEVSLAENEEAKGPEESAGVTESATSSDSAAHQGTGGETKATMTPTTNSGQKDDAGYPEQFEYIRQLIMKNVSFPLAARKMGLTGKLSVSFLVKEDGDVENIAIVASSGHSILDDTVIATIRRLAPFPKPPMRKQLILPFVFNLH